MFGERGEVFPTVIVAALKKEGDGLIVDDPRGTLVELGRTLGLVTLAEGIETHEQLEGLRGELCEQGQGFLFSGPVDAAEMAALLDTAQAGQPAAAVGVDPGRPGAAKPRLPSVRRHATSGGPTTGRSGAR